MKLYGLCQLTLIPVRREPSEQSEMVTQLLFGETFDILFQSNGWSQIITHFDNYNGWISTKMATILNADCMNVYSQLKPVILQKPIAILHSVNSGIPALILGGGSSLITDTGQINVKYPWLTFKNKTSIKSQSSRSSLIKNSLKYLNAPYLWGGRTIFGIDCSGLTQIIYKMAGYKLPRDAHQQAKI
jgi:hypothetical protein